MVGDPQCQALPFCRLPRCRKIGNFALSPNVAGDVGTVLLFWARRALAYPEYYQQNIWASHLLLSVECMRTGARNAYTARPLAWTKTLWPIQRCAVQTHHDPTPIAPAEPLTRPTTKQTRLPDENKLTRAGEYPIRVTEVD